MSKVYKLFNLIQARWFAGCRCLTTWWKRFVTTMEQDLESDSDEKWARGIIMFVTSSLITILLILGFMSALVELAKVGFLTKLLSG